MEVAVGLAMSPVISSTAYVVVGINKKIVLGMDFVFNQVLYKEVVPISINKF